MLTCRIELIAFMLFASASVAATLRTEDPVLKSSWERSIENLQTDEQSDVALPMELPPYLSTVLLEHGAGAAYATGSTRVLDAYTAFSRPAGADTAPPIRPDWPILLEQVARWDPQSDRTWDLVNRDLEVWLNHYLDKFSSEGLLKLAAMSRLPEDWSAHFPDVEAVHVQRFLDSALLHQALEAAARMRTETDLPSARYSAAAEALHHAFQSYLWNDEAGLYSTVAGGSSFSPWLNAIAIRSGLWPTENAASLTQLIKREGTNCPGEFVPSVIEASIRAGDPQLAYDLLSFITDFVQQPTIRLTVEAFGGLSADAGFQQVTVTPRTPRRIDFFRWTVHIPNGRLSLEWDRGVGYDVTVPPHVSVRMNPRQGAPITMQQRLSHAVGELTSEHIALLEQAEWTERTKGQMAIWVSVDDQMLRLIENGAVLFQARCATAEKGSGFIMNSLQTPLGWHTIAKKIGGDAPWGQVFRSRQATREIWQPGEDVKEDLVLTRILWLTGSESGKNKGGNVDSYNRAIYIHGTNDEIRIGTPSSHGCIRLTNDDVIEAYTLIPEKTPILITDGESF